MISSATPTGNTIAAQAPPAPVPVPVPAGLQGRPEPPALRPPAQNPPKPAIEVDPEKLREHLKRAIDQINEQLANSGRTLGFRMDDVLNAPVVTVKSSKTGEVIRQIPSEAVIKAAHTFEQLKGLLVDETS